MRSLAAVPIIVFVILALPADAGGQTPLTEAKLRERAELIITGRVQGHRDEDSEGANGSRTRRVSLTIKVETVEKGEAVQPGSELEARCWATLKQPVTGPGLDPGHATIPGDGGRAKFFLIRRNDEWRVIAPNGVERLDSTPPLTLPIEHPPPSVPSTPEGARRPPLLTWLFIAGALIVMVAATVRGVRHRRRDRSPG